MQSGRDRYERKIQTQLNLWGARLGILRARAARANAAAGIALQKQIDELHALQVAARQQLEEFSAMSDGKWTVTQASHEASWAELTSQVEASWRRVLR
jgi:hypothetical protein